MPRNRGHAQSRNHDEFGANVRVVLTLQQGLMVGARSSNGDLDSLCH